MNIDQPHRHNPTPSSASFPSPGSPPSAAGQNAWARRKPVLSRWVRRLRRPLGILALLLVLSSFATAPTSLTGALLTFAAWLSTWQIGLAALASLVRPIDKPTIAFTALALIISFFTTSLPPQIQRTQAQALGARIQKASKPERRISVLSYNILFKGGDREKTMSILESTRPDILFLQEVTPTWVKLIAKLDGLPYRFTQPHLGTHGFAVLSRYPISDLVYLYNNNGLPFAQCMTIKPPERPIATCNVHTASPAIVFHDLPNFIEAWKANATLRTDQWRQIRKHVEAQPHEALLVAGDFNTLEAEPLYRKMTASFVDLHTATNPSRSPSYPNLPALLPFPRVRIDYVLARGPFTPIKTEVLPGGGSDHLPVKATLTLHPKRPPKAQKPHHLPDAPIEHISPRQ